MGLELNKRSFRRFVQLYLVLTAIGFAIGILTAADRAWRALASGVRPVSSGGSDLSDPVGFALTLILVVHVASAVALLRFKQWARAGF